MTYKVSNLNPLELNFNQLLIFKTPCATILPQNIKCLPLQ